MTTPPAATEPAEEPQHTPALPWADLAVEHHQLLRLAPLPGDRATGARPLRFVQFGYAERHDPAHSLLRMQIGFPGQKVHKGHNRVDIRVDHQTKRVYLGDEHGLQLEPVNRGLGRFLLAQAAQWLQRKWPNYRVEAFALPSKDALEEDSRLRRDQCLRGVGLEVQYEDGQVLKGRTAETRVDQLEVGWNSERVQRLGLLDAAQLLQQADQQLQEGEARLRERDERVAKYQREDSGLRFTITCLVAFALFQAGLLIWIATR